MKAKVIGGALRLREAASVSAGVLLILPDGYPVEVTGTGKEWTPVKADDTEGYVMTRYLEVLPEEQPAQEKKAAKPKAKKKAAAKKAAE